MTKTIIILGLITISIIVYAIGYIIYNKRHVKSDNNNDTNNNNNNNERKYIEHKYKRLIYPLMGTTQRKNIEFKVFFMNRYDVTDIKLPYEFLSPIQTHKNNKNLFTLDIDNSQYDQYIITNAYGHQGMYAMTNLFNWRKSSQYKEHEKRLLDRDYHFITVGHNITRNYEVNQYYFDEYKNSINTGEGIKELINKHDLKSRSLMDFYLALFKKKQPSYDEMIDILTRFEKSLDQIKRIDQVNNSEKLNDMLETYANQNSHQKNNITKIDEDLASLIKNKDILN